MKRFLTLILGLLLIAAFASCEDDKIIDNAPPQDKTTVNTPQDSTTPSTPQDSTTPNTPQDNIPAESIPTENTPQAPVTSEITLDEAKAKALAHAELTEADVKFIKAEKDFDDGIVSYEIEFYNANNEFEYDIDAKTGSILKAEKNDINILTPPPSEPTQATPEASEITLDEAKAKALAHAGLAEADVIFEKAEKDFDDGVVKYEIEFRKGNIEYEYDIDAKTGTILKAEKD